MSLPKFTEAKPLVGDYYYRVLKYRGGNVVKLIKDGKVVDSFMTVTRARQEARKLRAQNG